MDVRAAGLAAAVLFFLEEKRMYSNELKAVQDALVVVEKALLGQEIDADIAGIAVEGGRAYDDAREMLAKITAIARAAKALAGRVAALEAA